MDCFDADVLIYAAAPEHPLGRAVAGLLDDRSAGYLRIGSVLLLPEVLGKPLRDGAQEDIRSLSAVLARLALGPVDRPRADLAAALSSRYRLRAADSVHLATAIRHGADRFVTNNRRDFSTAIAEVDVVYPDQLR